LYKLLHNLSQIKRFLWGNHGQIWAVWWVSTERKCVSSITI